MIVAGATLVTGIVGNVHIFKLKSVTDNTLNRTVITVKRGKDTAHLVVQAAVNELAPISIWHHSDILHENKCFYLLSPFHL